MLGTLPQLNSLELSLRAAWTKYQSAEKSLFKSRDTLAALLYELRTQLTADRQFRQTLERLEIPRTTAYDLIAGYEHVQSLNLPAVVQQVAQSKRIDLTTKRLAPVLATNAIKLQEVKTEDEAAAVLTLVKEESKRKPVQQTGVERREAKYQQLTTCCKASLTDLSVTDKIALLVKLISDVLPEAEVSITAPDAKIAAA